MMMMQFPVYYRNPMDSYNAHQMRLNELLARVEHNNYVARQHLAIVNNAFYRQHSDVDVQGLNIVGKFDVSKVDPIIREAAKNKRMKITFMDCSDLARQCAEVRRKAENKVDVFDMSKVDPIFREAAKDKALKISFMDCSDLARQCAEIRHRAGY
jgi:hypothetical protein